MTTIESDVDYEIGQESENLTEDIAIHREVGDSEFDFVMVGSNPDDGSDMVAFGFHIEEIPFVPVGSLTRTDR